MRQSWGSLLFLHWRIDAALLRPLIPQELDIDEFDGSAWIGVVPFTMWGIRKTRTPAIPGLSAFHELNVRTYVHHRGVPGVWFFSLDAAKRIPVHVARATYQLPYFLARMKLERMDNAIQYRSERIHKRAPAAMLDMAWQIGAPLPESQPGTLEFFLTERYALFAHGRRGLAHARIWHPPWPLQEAVVDRYASTMIEALGLPEPTDQPLAHFANELHVDIWALRSTDDRRDIP